MQRALIHPGIPGHTLGFLIVAGKMLDTCGSALGL